VHKAVCDHFVRKPKRIKEYEAQGGRVYVTHIIKDYENNRWDNVKYITHDELVTTEERVEIAKRTWETRKDRYGKTGTRKGLKKTLKNKIIKNKHHEIII
jgi:hypothetical protein